MADGIGAHRNPIRSVAVSGPRREPSSDFVTTQIEDISRILILMVLGVFVLVAAWFSLRHKRHKQPDLSSNLSLLE